MLIFSTYLEPKPIEDPRKPGAGYNTQNKIEEESGKASNVTGAYANLLKGKVDYYTRIYEF